MFKLLKNIFILLILSFTYQITAQDFKILVFSKTAGFTHGSIGSGISMLEQLGTENNFDVDTTEDASLFTTANLQQYAAVVFLSTTGDVLNNSQQSAFEQYIQAGGGYVGIHAASDTEYDWPWYGDLVGAYFSNHPPGTHEADIKVSDHVHPSTENLPFSWTRTDEWYNFEQNPRGDVHVLATLDETSYSGGEMGYDHPIIWCHEFDGGRSWYTAGGHTNDSFSEPLFVEHILGGIFYAAKRVNGNFDATVDANFEVSVIENNPSNPMGLAVLPDNKVLFIERSGNVKLYNPITGTVSIAANFDVDSNREDGLLGIALDPDFDTNNWLYLFYSPAGNEDIQHVSRFTFTGTTINMNSEEILMVIPVQREECCHSGGDLEFDSHGNLYIALGDNINPFSSNGYTPIDERTHYLDAQGTSANTKDYRGKILRITPEDNGTYSIPEGNLFTDANEGYPEIYTMGHRNPFRFTVGPDDYLYVGEVGPDSNSNSNTRGPRGYDEFNRTNVATNFGWPYCIADNQPYVDYNFQTGASGANFDCDNPVNTSPFNTGAINLPAASPAWMWYHDGETDAFPALGTGGGRTAMAGAVYEYDSSSSSEVKFPEYYNNSIFLYEWSRNWIREVKVDNAGNIISINPFLESLDLNRPIDMDFGPDGAMYLIEWGTGFGGNNSDSRILKISFKNGNRTPTAIATADPIAGLLPLTVNFDASSSFDTDPVDVLSYEWDFDGDGNFDDTGATLSNTYTEPGVYNVLLKVTDNNGLSSFANLSITAGNSIPEVNIENPVNGGFFIWGETIDFNINVTDLEDGTTENGSINCANISALAAIGHDDHGHDLNASENCEDSFTTQAHGDDADNVFYVLTGSYSDNGADGVDSITATDTHILQPKVKEAEHFTSQSGIQTEITEDNLGGGINIGFIENNDYISFDPMNLQGITHITFRAASDTNGGTIEVRTDAPNGPLVGTRNIPSTGGWQVWDYFSMPIQDPGGTHELFFVFKGANGFLFNINWIEFHGQGVANEDLNAVNGLQASYYNNTNFTGTPITTKDPQIAFNWGNTSPLPGINANAFSVLWEGYIEIEQTGNYNLFSNHTGGNINIEIDGVTITNETTDGSFLSNSITLTAGEAHAIRVAYVHTAGDAAISLGWEENNTIHQSSFNTDGEGSTSIPPATDCDALNAFSVIQAEDFCEQSGIEPSPAETAVGFVNNGDWIMHNIDFGTNGPQSITVSVASATNGGTIEVRHHGVEGSLLGVLEVGNTSGWTSFETVTIEVENITGIHPVYLVFKGGDGFLFDVDWFQFAEEEETEIPTGSCGTKSAFNLTQAEGFCEQSGIQLSPSNTAVGFIHDGDWIMHNIDFGTNGPRSITASVASATNGGTIEVRHHGIEGSLLGVLEVENTGGWTTFETVTIEVENITGIHPVYLVFKGGDGFLFDVDWFQFTEEETEIPTGSCDTKSAFNLTQAEGFCEQSGIQLSPSNTAVGFIHDGDWIMHNIDFGTNGPRSITASVASATNGGTIEVRHHGIEGSLLGILEVENTGGWTTFETISVDINNITGTHPVYFVFRGGNGFLFDMDWFQFAEEETEIPTGSCDTKSAFNLTQAEGFCEQSGIELSPSNTAVGFIHDGDWIMHNIDFGTNGPQSITASVASATNGGTIEVRHHGVEGSLLGILEVENTGGWTTFETISVDINNITGTHPVYFVFRGGNGFLFDMDWFQFAEEETEIPVPPVGSENLALSGIASQSTTDYGGEANRAIDNNTNGVWENDSVTHTNNDGAAYWQVALAQTSNIEQIVIWNRIDECCINRLANFTVSVLDTDDSVVWETTYTNITEPTLIIDLETTGAIVRVSLNGILSLAEVQVFGTESSNTSEFVDGTIVHITKSNAPNFAIDGGVRSYNGQDIYLWDSNINNENQQWIEIDRGNGFYSYQKMGSNHCIDGGLTDAFHGQNVYLWTCGDTNQNQHWQKILMEDGSYRLIKRNDLGFAINGGNDGANWQNVNLWNSSHPSSNLNWFISPLDASAKSTNAIGTNNELKIYPNPVVDLVTVTLVDDRVTGEIIYKISDLTGRNLGRKVSADKTQEFFLNDLAPGMYILEVETALKKYIRKIVKQ